MRSQLMDWPQRTVAWCRPFDVNRVKSGAVALLITASEAVTAPAVTALFGDIGKLP